MFIVKPRGLQFFRLLVLVLLLVGFGAIPLCLAQEAEAPSEIRQRDAVFRTIPRKDLYANLGGDLGVKAKDVKELILPLEDKGFGLRDAIVLLWMAKARSDQLIQMGQLPKTQPEKALKASVDYLVNLVENEAAGWTTLAKQTGAKIDLLALRFKAGLAIGLWSQTASVARVTPLGKSSQPAQAKSTQPAEEKGPQAQETGTQTQARSLSRPKGGSGPREAIRQADPVAEKTLPRGDILKNLGKALAVDEGTAKSLLTKLEAEMPLRESVMLLVISKALADKKIKQGEFTKEQRREALEDGVTAVLPIVRQGEGWGDIGGRVGVPMTGRNINMRANEVLGQE